VTCRQPVGPTSWCDHIHRAMLTTGRLAGMIGDDKLRGLTLHPAIFDQAGAEGPTTAPASLGPGLQAVADRLEEEEVAICTKSFGNKQGAGRKPRHACSPQRRRRLHRLCRRWVR
jgi:hypothetical protein